MKNQGTKQKDIRLPETATEQKPKDVMEIAKIVGRRIANLRKAKKLSQNDLSRLAKLDRSFISEIENGKKNISILVLEKIARALQTSMGYLLEGPDEEDLS